MGDTIFGALCYHENTKSYITTKLGIKAFDIKHEKETYQIWMPSSDKFYKVVNKKAVEITDEELIEKIKARN